MRRLNAIVMLLVVGLFAAASAGCTDTKIPLFNPKARTLNRIYSAKEVIAEANRKAAQYVKNGWLTQQYVDDNIGPVLDGAQKGVEEAEQLYSISEDEAGAKTKLDSIADTLKNLRDALDQINKEHSQSTADDVPIPIRALAA